MASLLLSSASSSPALAPLPTVGDLLEQEQLNKQERMRMLHSQLHAHFLATSTPAADQEMTSSAPEPVAAPAPITAPAPAPAPAPSRQALSYATTGNSTFSRACVYFDNGHFLEFEPRNRVAFPPEELRKLNQFAKKRAGKLFVHVVNSPTVSCGQQMMGVRSRRR